MKCICVDADNNGHFIQLKEGNIYDCEPPKKTYPIAAYWVAEFGYHYDASRFIPLSTIDETELLHNRQTELV